MRNEAVLFFYHAGPGYQVQDAKLSREHLSLLSHQERPLVSSFFTQGCDMWTQRQMYTQERYVKTEEDIYKLGNTFSKGSWERAKTMSFTAAGRVTPPAP